MSSGILTLLIVHLSLGALLIISVIVRFIGVMTHRIDSQVGKYFVVGLGSALVLSGVALEIITKSPLTGACLSSLAIISAIILYELGLGYLVKSKFSSNK